LPANVQANISALSPLLPNYITKTLSAANIAAMFATPVEIIAAPGANKLINIISVVWELDWGSTLYLLGGPTGLQYGNTANLAGPRADQSGITATTLLAANTNQILLDFGGAAAIAGVPSAASDMVNKGIFASNTIAAFTTGNSTINLYITYNIVTTAS
jgi:hypothetical protein